MENNLPTLNDEINLADEERRSRDFWKCLGLENATNEEKKRVLEVRAAARGQLATSAALLRLTGDLPGKDIENESF